MKISSVSFRRWMAAVIVLFLAGQACMPSLVNIPDLTGASATPPIIIPTNTQYPAAQITFTAVLPEPLQPGESLFLVILDEVTGLPLRPGYNHFPMAARDTLTYSANVALPVNSIVKYRYVRNQNVVEDTSFDTPIRYRLYNVVASGEQRDIVASWSDRTYNFPKGTIHGNVINTDNGLPVPNILVTAGGVQAITNSLGEFDLPGLPVGAQQLVAYSLDGNFLPFQQGANVGDNQITTVSNLGVKPTHSVNVTFNVRVPIEQGTTPPPVRIVGNLLQLGNTFADLPGGVSVVANRVQDMTLQPDGTFQITMQLPVGAYIQYKYTLGDGYWNAEHTTGGDGWMLREFIVPALDTVLHDAVETWVSSDSSGAITFEASVPAVTLAEDKVYIQFNQFGWMEPLPMWPQGNNRWKFTLYGPLNFLSFSYRFCRNGQCGSADDSQSVGDSPAGYPASTSFISETFPTTITSWKWFENPETLPLVGYSITQRSVGFLAGVELQSNYRPNQSFFMDQALVNIKATDAIGANFVVITPSWSYQSASPLKFAIQPGKDPFWTDTVAMVQKARNQGLIAAVFPTPQFPPSPDPSISASTQFWRNAPKDAAWWQSWFAQYRSFLINYADLASQAGAQTLILGGEWVTPALPGGLLPDGSASNVPADAETQWRNILTDVRNHFKGQVLWALPYEKSSFTTPVSFLRDVDGIYLLWSTSIAINPAASKTDYANEAGRLLDNEVAPLASLIGKPVILALSYPSATGAATGCVSNNSGGCLDFNALSRPNTDVSAANLDLQAQADIYESILIAVNARPWVSGVVSRGYYMPAALQDKSTSVHGKPAATVLWYWYSRLLGVVH